MADVVEQRPLGRSERTVSSVALGTAALALPYGPPGAPRRPPDAHSAVRVITAALERGITLVDTAPVYDDAEEIVARAIKRRECMVATKVAAPTGGWDACPTADLARHVRSSVEASLRRLGRGCIDILLAHNATRGALEAGALGHVLASLRADGLAAYIGATVYDPSEAGAAIVSPDLDVVQLPYSALDRRPAQLLDDATRQGIAVVARSVLLRGVLSGAARTLNGHFAPLRDAAEAFRAAVGASWEELPGAALAFILEDRRVASVLVGPRDEAELAALLDCAPGFVGLTAPPVRQLPEDLLDPRRWPPEVAHV